jgi:hypothetical protein
VINLESSNVIYCIESRKSAKATGHRSFISVLAAIELQPMRTCVARELIAFASDLSDDEINVRPVHGNGAP